MSTAQAIAQGLELDACSGPRSRVTRLVRCFVTCAALATASCEKPATTSSAAVGCPGIPDCGKCVDHVRAWMRDLVAEGNGYPLWPQERDVDLVSVPSTQPTIALRVMPTIVIGRHTVTFSGEGFATTDELEVVELHDRLVQERGFMCARRSAGDDSPWEVTVQVDSTAPWRTVRTVIATAEATGVQGIVFAVLKPTSVARPGPSSIDDKIEEIDEEIEASRRAGRLTLEAPSPDHPFELVYGRCRSAYEGVQATHGGAGGAIDRYLAEGLPNDIARCGCNVDVEAVKALHWWWSGRRMHPNAAIPVGVRVPLTGTAARTAISAEDTAPWSSAHQQVLAAVREPGPFFLSHPADTQASVRSVPRTAIDVCAPNPPDDEPEL